MMRLVYLRTTIVGLCQIIILIWVLIVMAKLRVGQWNPSLGCAQLSFWRNVMGFRKRKWGGRGERKRGWRQGHSQKFILRGPICNFPLQNLNTKKKKKKKNCSVNTIIIIQKSIEYKIINFDISSYSQQLFSSLLIYTKIFTLILKLSTHHYS